MPTYDYECLTCDVVTEVFHGMSKKPTIRCPDCNRKMKRLFTPTTHFILKGPITDYPSKRIKWNKEQTDKNNQAGRRMRINHEPAPKPKLGMTSDEAYDNLINSNSDDELLERVVSPKETKKMLDNQVNTSQGVGNTPNVKSIENDEYAVATASDKLGIANKVAKKKNIKIKRKWNKKDD